MTSAHRELADSIYRAFNRGDLDSLDRYFTVDVVDHEVPPGLPTGIPGVKALVSMYRSAFPDLRFEMLDMISEGDRAACLMRITGTNTGEFMGQPPTGRAVDVGGIDYVRVRDGKVCEHWGYTAEMAMMEQLGLGATAPEQRAPIELPRETTAR